ncbi:MAG: hypothetical protein ACO1SV_00280 [Fimbriimonas sp.]
MKYRALFIPAVMLLAGSVLVGCGDPAMTPAEEQKLKDGFTKPPKLGDLPPDERARIQGMIDAQKGGASAPKGQTTTGG